MSDNAGADGARYWGFISYSHKDAAFGRKLHRRLETYALPRRLVGKMARHGVVPRKLSPIFRDREELSAAGDLSSEVRAALAASRSLIVVCSPAAVSSHWVSREIETFRELHPDRPVLAAIRTGEPLLAMPAALRAINNGGFAIEPLAADFRDGKDGEHLGLLKLVAGILGLGLDELVQRDSQRRIRRVTAVTAAALVAMLVMGALTVLAITARYEAERLRAGGEGLVRFMYTDLREQLRGVGRLDLMNAVNQRALKYYDREIGSLPPDSLAQRAQVLFAIGEDDSNRDGTPAELRRYQTDEIKRFQEGCNTTRALLAKSPNQPERIFDQAQCEYWLGYYAYGKGDFGDAKARFRSYKMYADKLTAVAPGSPRFERETAYAEGNLCAVALQPPKDLRGSLKLCSDSLERMRTVARTSTFSESIGADLAQRESWAASAFMANGDDSRAASHLKTQETILDKLLKSDPFNIELRSDWIALQRLLARAEAHHGNLKDAIFRLQAANTVLNLMIALDPRRKDWVLQKSKVALQTSKLEEEFKEKKQ